MDRILIHEFDASHLSDLTKAVEVCNEPGVPLGVFVPTPAPCLPGEPDFDWAQLRAELGESSKEGKSLDDIWLSLGAQ